MGKKTDTSKKATAPAKAGSSKPRRARKPDARQAPVLSTDDIALRAYFLAEKRLLEGLPGDDHEDWLEAERQLRTEAKGTKPASRRKVPAA